MLLRDRLRMRYFADWTEAILEDVYRTYWAPHIAPRRWK